MAEPNFGRLPVFTMTLVALVILTLATRLPAQVSGTISGFVTDPSGATITEAKVTATLVEQNAPRTTESNSEGFYNFPALPPGTYTVSVERSGFQRLTRTGIVLTVNQNVRLDLSLQLGAVTQSMVVAAEAPLVDTRSSTVSGLIEDRRVVDLPLNGRNVIALAVTVPGVLNVTAPEQLRDARSGPKMDVNGGRDNMNLFTLNGAYFNNPSRNTGMNYPPPDAVQEFRIQTANFSAEYGHNPGSQVTVVTKAGTNQFHASAWEFLRNDKLNARSFFNTTKPTIRENQFGAAGGGRLIRDKLFGFGAYQGLRVRPQATPVQAFVPSAAQRNGDFSSLPPGTLRNPIDVFTGNPFSDSSGTPCVANNIINPNCISPVSKNLLQFVPQSSSGTVVSLGSNPSNGSMGLGRIDWNRGSTHTLFGTFLIDHNTRSNPFASSGNLAGYISESIVQETDEVSVNDTYTFSPALVNQTLVSFLRTTSFQSQSRTVAPSALGINMPQYVPTGAVSINLPGLFNLGSGFTTRFINNNWQVRDALTWMKGKHTFKFGGQVVHLHFVQRFIGSPAFRFTGSRSGNPVADFMLGAFNRLNVNFGVRDNDDLTLLPSGFFQDEYKLTPRFTVTYGIRYEPYNFWHDNHDRIDTIVVGRQSTRVPDAPPGILFPGDGLPRSLVGWDKNNFAPRLGFAWDVLGDGKTSVRGAYGVFYESINADSLAQENPPFAGFAQASNGRVEDPFGSVGQTAPPASLVGKFGCLPVSTRPGLKCPLFPLPVGGLFTDLSLRTPYVQAWNLTVQRQLTPNVMVEAGYIGKIGTRIEALRNFNPARFIPGTTFDPVTGLENTVSTPANINDRVLFEPGILSPQGFLLGNDFRSWYHSFQGQVTKRYSRGLSVTGSYTLSKSLDTSSTDNLGATVSNPFDLRTERGRSSWDRRHAFVLSWVWSPTLQFAEPWKNKLMGAWTFTGITTVQSGAPLTFVGGEDLALDGTDDDQHAFLNGAVIGRDHTGRGDEVRQFFNTAAFIRSNCAFVPSQGNPQAIEQQNCTPFGLTFSLLGKYGNAGRGILSGPARANSDFSIIKDFPFKERYKAQFRSEFFNLFNQVNFNNPVTDVSSGAFGRIRGSASGRVIQFALKFLW